MSLTPINDRPALLFPTGADSSHVWTFPAPQGITGTPEVVVYWIADGVTGNVAWEVDVEAITPSDAVDLDAATSFDTVNTSGGQSVPAVAGVLARAVVEVANADSVAAGDYVRLRVTRDVGVAGNSSANAYVLAVEVRGA